MTFVLAAGGVVVRNGDGGPEILVVHRPRYDDWSLPKGKLHADETFEQAAAREVEEETGVAVRLRDEIGSVRYADRRGRPKLVRYWLMEADDHTTSIGAPDEVDEARWVSVPQALSLLTYAHDRELVARAT